MANIVQYENQVWGEDTSIAGERLSTNGHYTGEHKGTPMQDALTSGTDVAHGVEAATVRYGTMTQDSIEGSTPEIVVEDDEATETTDTE